MDINYSSFIFLSVITFSFGYITGRGRSFNFNTVIFFGVTTLPFVIGFGHTQTHITVMMVAYFSGFLLPKAYALEGLVGTVQDLSNIVSNIINAFRYRDDYETFKRQKEETHQWRQKYERAEAEANEYRTRYRQEQQRRQSESNRQRQRQQKSSEKQQQNSKSENSGHSNKKQYSGPEWDKRHYLKILGLDPDREYTKKAIKTAYRRMANKYHPDKHPDLTDEEKESLADMFKTVSEAYKWLDTNS